MNILCTGSAGFIGGHVVDRLHALGHTVIGLDNLDIRVHPERKKPTWWCQGVPLYVQNVRDPRHLLQQHPKIDTVIHLAAQVSVADSMDDPMRYTDENTTGTALFLHALRGLAQAGTLKRLVVASSMSVYGEGGVRVKESEPVCPASPYGLSKYDQERLCLIWGAQHRVPTIALRFFNVYGPRQALTNPYTGVLANFAMRLLRDEPPIIYEDGGQTRDFVYVEDVARAVELAALIEQPVQGVFNICTGAAISGLHAARALANALNRGYIEPTITGTARPGDIRHCTGHPGRASSLLNFHTRWPFDVGILEYARYLMQV